MVGLGLGLAGVRGLVALIEQQLPGEAVASLNWHMLGFALSMALVTGVVFGLVPAMATMKTNVNPVLRDDSARGSAARGTGATRGALVVAEVGLAVMLLVGADLMAKSYSQLQGVSPGFATDPVLTAQLALPATTYPDATAQRTFWTRLVAEAGRIPGVTAVSLTTNVPFNGMVSSGSYGLVGYTLGSTEAAPHGRQVVVAPSTAPTGANPSPRSGSTTR